MVVSRCSGIGPPSGIPPLGRALGSTAFVGAAGGLSSLERFTTTSIRRARRRSLPALLWLASPACVTGWFWHIGNTPPSLYCLICTYLCPIQGYTGGIPKSFSCGGTLAFTRYCFTSRLLCTKTNHPFIDPLPPV